MGLVKGEYTFRYQLTESLELISNEWLSIEERKKRLPLVELDQEKPLLILLSWVAAKKIHAYKYADIYLEKGFDVLLVSTSAWKMLVPGSGFLVTCSDLADFLNENQGYKPLVVHALSIGCVVWAFTEELISKNPDKYQYTNDRLSGSIYDSPPNGRISSLLSYVVFKKDSIFRLIAEQVIRLLLLLTYYVFCKHFEHASNFIFNPPLKLPRLLLLSKNDPISDYKSNMKACEVWKAKGMQMNVKLWENSVHVSHFLVHRQEYLSQINLFLTSIGLLNLGKKYHENL